MLYVFNVDDYNVFMQNIIIIWIVDRLLKEMNKIIIYLLEI